MNLSFGGLRFTAHTPAGRIEIESPLVGKINVYNILAAIGAGVALNIPREKIAEGIAALRSVPGRFERVDCGQPFLVIVDYAHTDDALRNLLATARDLSPAGRIIALFGCGGDRDRAKRPMMGEAAGRAADFVVLTSDNPRSEDPLLIINDALVGLQRTRTPYKVEADRERAIGIALDEARAGDIVLLAGKGHETYQVMKDKTLDFDDRDVARRLLHDRGYDKTDIRPALFGGPEADGTGAESSGQAWPSRGVMQWTVQQVARALGVTAPQGSTPWRWLAGVSIDSRSVGRGELFFAIHGPRHDGHAFVGGALAGGAGAAVVDAGAYRRISQPRLGENFSASTTRLRDCSNWRGKFGAHGADALPPWQARWARPQQKRFWRRSLARGSAY